MLASPPLLRYSAFRYKERSVMKKNISTTLTIASIVLILDTFNAAQAAITFMLTGIIPGTDISISASLMLVFYALAAGFTAARIASGIALRHTEAL